MCWRKRQKGTGNQDKEKLTLNDTRVANAEIAELQANEGIESRSIERQHRHVGEHRRCHQAGKQRSQLERQREPGVGSQLVKGEGGVVFGGSRDGSLKVPECLGLRVREVSRGPGLEGGGS